MPPGHEIRRAVPSGARQVGASHGKRPGACTIAVAQTMQPNCTSRHLFAVSALLLCWFAPCVTHAEPVHSGGLDRVSQIRNLSASQAARGLPVRLRAVVTYYDPVSLELFVQDASGGVYVQSEKPLNIQRGQEIELTGITGPGDFAPEVIKPQVRVLGPGALPAPRRVTIEDMASGREDSQWVEAGGVVHSAVIEDNRLNLEVSTDGRRLRVRIVNFPPGNPDRLIESRVHFHGACGATFNNKRQLTGILVYLQDFNDLVIEEMPGATLARFPLRRASSLLRFTPDTSPEQRVRVRGVVTFQQLGRALFIRDGDQDLMTLSRQKLPVNPGDQVEVLGFPSLGDYAPILQDGIFQKLGSQAAPGATRATAEQLLKGDLDNSLVEVDGKLLTRTRTSRGDLLALKAGGRIFNAQIEEPESDPAIASLEEGSDLRVRGICMVETGGGNNDPQSFHVLLRTPEDIVVLHRAPLWTLARMLWFLLVVAVVAFIAVGWVLLLRGQVRAQTAQLERKNKELAVALAAANEATHLKSEFLANISHEIRTPMNGILGMTDIVLDSRLSAEQRENLTIAKNSAESLLGLLNDVLDFSRIEAGRLDLVPEAFSLRQCVKNAVGTVLPTAGQKSVDVRVEVAPDVPDDLVGDGARLRQVLFNLLNNAVKFTSAGSIDTSVRRYSLRHPTVCLQFSVCDTGVGIPADKMDLIFEAFRQADGSNARRYGGTGLGLTLSSRLVSLMGGRIWVESEPGKGSTFHFTAEFQAAGRPAEPAHDAGPPVAPHESASTPLRILLAEDNLINQKIASKLLESRGHSVKTVYNGREVLAALESAQFDLVLMDIQMPVMDGFACATEIRRRENATGDHLPIVAITAHAASGDGERCAQAGVDEYVTKPLRPRELFQAIQSSLSARLQSRVS